MEKWNIRSNLKINQERIQSQTIQIRRGIFQGDSLSPFLFGFALIPLTLILLTWRIWCAPKMAANDRWDLTRRLKG